MESNHDGNQKENNNDITTLPNDIATNTSTTNDNNLTANTKDNFIDDEEIEIDLDKVIINFYTLLLLLISLLGPICIQPYCL